MKTAFKTFLVLLGVFAAVFSLSADELDNYVILLDRAERNFWSAAFASPNSSIRKAYQENLVKLEQSARKIDDFRRKNDSRLNYGDLKRPGMLLGSLLGTHSAFKKRLSFSGIKPTTLAEIRKELSKKGVSSNKRMIREADISLEDYIEILNFIRDENIDILSKKISSAGTLKHFEQDVLLRTAQIFYTTITDARLASFKLRKKDSLFRRGNKSADKR